jgi:hypothetical protein
MPFNRILLSFLLLEVTTLVHGQKAWPGDITAMLSKVPVPVSSASCYGQSSKVTDPSTKLVTIKDNGPAFTDLEAQLQNIMKAAMSAAQAQGQGMAAPNADQLAQMQQQAMQRAAAAQSSSPQQMAQQYRSSSGAPSSGDMAVMKLIGQAQTAAGNINRLSLEMTQRMEKISKNLDSVRMPPNCPEVQQGGYAGPTCACLRGHEVDYRTRRVAAINGYVDAVAALVREYLPKMRAEAAIIDDMEAKAKYGEGVSNPAFRQMAVSIQRQGFGSVTSLLSLSGGAWKDSAEEYANLVNAQSGASIPCSSK